MRKNFVIQENQTQRGQALITMIFFIVIAVSILSVSAVILASSMQASTSSEQGLLAYSAAESGAEDGILRVLRKPTYSASTSYTLEDAQISLSVSSNADYTTTTINSTATVGTVSRSIQVQTSRVNGVLSIISWKEI